jgi:ABC-type uncharacterized transport system involved in gliding motility auxiliary subunit
VIGNSTFIGKDNIDAYGNRDFFLSCVSWLAGGAGIESISPKIISADRLIVRGTDFIVLLVLAVIVLPLAPFTAAFLTWYRRRNR